jgi:zeta-carotene desaturase
MGVPAVPLRDLYRADSWQSLGDVTLSFRCPAERVHLKGGSVGGVSVAGGRLQADSYVCAIPFERVNALFPELGIDKGLFEHSPITGIHLWFDRPVTRLPHATLLDRNIQWMFNKSGGRYLELVVSASRGLTAQSREEVIALALAELKEFFPEAASAKLVRAHVAKELRATFSAAPGTERLRPAAQTRFPNFFLAGDWTRSGWPPTMEGAVRSGYQAAEAVAAAAGRPAQFMLPDNGPSLR